MKSSSEILVAHDKSTTPPKPIHVTRKFMADGHMHVRGRTRSGKTSRVLLPLAHQLMQPYHEDGKDQRDPIFIFDLGGDLALFNYVRREAQKLDRTFRFLSLHPDDNSASFDPFQALLPGDRHIMRVTTLLIEAFNLDNGLIYGGQYFTAQNLAALLSAVRKFSQEEGKHLTLHNVATHLEREARSRRIRDADQIRMTFNFLLEYPQLDLDGTADPDHSINMNRALEEGEVIYFFAPTLGEMTTARQIAGLGLYNLIYAAMQRSRNELPTVRAWTIVDEFHELTGRAFEALLAQSAKFGVSLILANQTTSQLESRDSSLHQIVFDNSHIKLYLTVTGKRDIEDLQGLSEEFDDMIRSRSAKGFEGVAPGLHGIRVPSLSRNEILAISGTDGECILIIDDGHGYSEPKRAELRYLIGTEEYLKDRHTAIPRKSKEESAQASAKVIRATVRRTLRRAPDPLRQKQMSELLAIKRLSEAVTSTDKA